MILQLNAEHPQPRKIERVVQVLKEGGLAAYPTDTVYGIGCDIFNRQGVEKLHNLVRHMKDREHSQLSFICRDLSNISEYAFISDFAYRTMKRLLPGPYTFILPATKLVPKVMLTKRKTVGIRVPDAPIALEIVGMLGNAIATTSAMWDGELVADPWTLEDVYGHTLGAVVDGGYVFPEPSTVIDFSNDVPELIRLGKGPIDDIELS